jgi:hypothetical protein
MDSKPFPDLKPLTDTGEKSSAAAAQEAAKEENFPMLTEVVHVPRYSKTELPDTLSEVDWAQLALRVRENVLERLMRRSELLLDSQMKATLQTITERAAESLAAQLHDSLSQLIRDIVARAVNEELTRLHTEIARSQNK